jgi:hypothetical protein
MLGANVGPAMTFETLAAIMLVQMARESEFAEDFVTDRGPLDMLAYARILRHHATQATSNLISSSIETVARSWLERAHYDLIVYHDALCGARGSEMKQRNSEYLKQLAECFESIIADLQLDVVRMPGDLTVEARCSLITNMLVQ